MNCGAQLSLCVERQPALDHYPYAPQQVKDLSAVTIHNHLSDMHLFIAWRECFWPEVKEDCSFTPQAVVPLVLIRYGFYLQTALWLKSTTVNSTKMSLKYYFALPAKVRVLQSDPKIVLKFMPKEAPSPSYLNSEGENALVALVNTIGTQRYQTTKILFLHIGLRAQELSVFALAVLLGQTKWDVAHHWLAKESSRSAVECNDSICAREVSSGASPEITVSLPVRKNTKGVDWKSSRSSDYQICHSSKGSWHHLAQPAPSFKEPHGRAVPLHELTQILDHDA